MRWRRMAANIAQSASAFTLALRKTFGVSPGEIRRKSQAT
jgi:AraC-like DNA-binding protein